MRKFFGMVWPPSCTRRDARSRTKSSVEHHDFNVVGLQKVSSTRVYKIPKWSCSPAPTSTAATRQSAADSEDAPLSAPVPFSDIRDLSARHARECVFLAQSHDDTVILRPRTILGHGENAPSNY